ncbi:MAG: cupin domain-containing protein [Chloroflexota bacterium]
MYTQMGDYKVVSSVQTEECSLRLLKLERGESVGRHHHQGTTQIYFVLEGEVETVMAGSTRRLRPYEMLRVPPGTPHGLHAPGMCLVLSISIPPLEMEDQHPEK